MKNKAAENPEVKKFLTEHKYDMPDLFRMYDYDGDYYEDGFPKRFDLEQRILKAAKQNSFKKKDLKMIFLWGHNHRNIKKIDNVDRPIKILLYYNNEPLQELGELPEKIIANVKIPGFGPTYSSKILHFSVPQVFGALDTWLVRTFGEGDQDHQSYKFLNLTVKNYGNGWLIPKTKRIWPTEFGKWIRILNYIADQLNEEKILCPHPKKFLKKGLRKPGIWYPADVESALFCYAYEGRGEKIIRDLKFNNLRASISRKESLKIL